MNEVNMNYHSEVTSSASIGFNPLRNKFLLNTKCKFTEDVSTPTLKKPNRKETLQLSPPEGRKLKTSLSRNHFSGLQQSEPKVERKSIGNSSPEPSSADSPSTRELDEEGILSFTKRFYRRCEKFLDSLGLQTTDPNELFENLDELKRLSVSKNNSTAGNPLSIEDLSLKGSRSDSLGPVINRNLFESSLLQRRSSTGKTPQPSCFAKTTWKRSQFHIPRDSSFGETEHDDGPIEEMNDSRSSSKFWNAEAHGVLSSENSPSPLGYKSNKKRDSVLILPCSNGEESPFMPAIQLLRKKTIQGDSKNNQ
jgi:hypothetical protein